MKRLIRFILIFVAISSYSLSLQADSNVDINTLLNSHNTAVLQGPVIDTACESAKSVLGFSIIFFPFEYEDKSGIKIKGVLTAIISDKENGKCEITLDSNTINLLNSLAKNFEAESINVDLK